MPKQILAQTLVHTFLLGFVGFLVVATHAFVPPGLLGTPSRMANERLASSFGVPSTYLTTTTTTTTSTQRVWMAAKNEQEDKAADNEAEHVMAGLVTEEENKEKLKEEKEEEPKDELTTLKKEIASLEAHRLFSFGSVP
jgi:hypothetical protein